MKGSTNIRLVDAKVTYSNIPRKLHQAFKMYAASVAMTERELIIHCMMDHAEPFLDHVEMDWPEDFDPEQFKGPTRK